MPEFTVYIDNQCPVCRREVNMLRWMDRKKRIEFVDISAPGFIPPDADHPFSTLMAEICGHHADGTWVKGVETFRVLYSLVGFRWIVPITRLPGISHLMDWGYRVFARNRIRWFGGCTEACRMPAKAETIE